MNDCPDRKPAPDAEYVFCGRLDALVGWHHGLPKSFCETCTGESWRAVLPDALAARVAGDHLAAKGGPDRPASARTTTQEQALTSLRDLAGPDAASNALERAVELGLDLTEAKRLADVVLAGSAVAEPNPPLTEGRT